MFPRCFTIESCKLHRSAGGQLPRRVTILLAISLVVPDILVAAGRADTTYSATLLASLTVSGFLDAAHDPISKPSDSQFGP